MLFTLSWRMGAGWIEGEGNKERSSFFKFWLNTEATVAMAQTLRF